ncbi:hypothetical protein ASPZODRAFT_124125 [Penicilliopsis zonata CBS 506.65]|uniref:DNA polymerase epsilon subunit B n=1 Tax=Penicilliopsis zonata CBS 506.65 TaxID=1073090 RepID=A0A1L9S840_9EURO|nr:hypothetical protein ASPZODRAFT_124125 [Penicilliopsis zonata CBS 506.65]OJJ43317.1 hypothetical protein ASPZODRAFT_124125 [Penicilliopsis zonata CBS 506.65]
MSVTGRASAPTIQRDAADLVPSSSPAFGTPAHPFRITKPGPDRPKTSVLPILLPVSTLRPVAFRAFTRKHNLTLSSSTLQTLANFVGKNCGSGWREEGLAERVLDEVAKAWKKAGGGVIVEEGKGASVKTILQSLEGNIIGGRVVTGKTSPDGVVISMKGAPSELSTYDSTATAEDKENEESDLSLHPRSWMKIVGAYEMPRLLYNVEKKFFEISKSNPTLFPPPSHKTSLFKERYNLIYQRLLRNEAFQTALSFSETLPLQRSLGPNQSYKLTPIANLLGRSGTSHLLLGLLSISPTGDLSLTDLSGSVCLDLSHARIIPQDGAWFTPGMIVVVDGIYEEEENVRGSTLGGNSGVGGMIGGRFVGVTICGPPCERRDISLGVKSRPDSADFNSGGGFGWVDFLGVGSERAQGPRMRKIEAKCLQSEHPTEASKRLKVAILSEVNLDDSKTIGALKKVFKSYNDLILSERPLAFILIGNFIGKGVADGGGQISSIEYKECFDSLALILSEFPSILRHSTFVFVPGSQDPWASAFSSGASSTIPRDAVPELFTSRVKRAFSTANSESDTPTSAEPAGEAIWTSNPSRLTLFGPVHEITVLRDDISSRFRRSSVIFDCEAPDPATLEPKDVDMGSALDSATLEDLGETPRLPPKSEDLRSAMHSARKLVKTILDQGTMSPFPLSIRPVLWDYSAALHLFPLPTALVLSDSEISSFCITYEGCHVMNPGRLVPENDSNLVRWIEYDVLKNRGKLKEDRF